MTTLSPSRQLELKLAEVYVTLKQSSGEHKVGCYCSTCQWVEQYQIENKLTDDNLYDSIISMEEKMDDGDYPYIPQ